MGILLVEIVQISALGTQDDPQVDDCRTSAPSACDVAQLAPRSIGEWPKDVLPGLCSRSLIDTAAATKQRWFIGHTRATEQRPTQSAFSPPTAGTALH